MNAEKKKLAEALALKFLEMLDEINRESPDLSPGMFSPNMCEFRKRWEAYIHSLGCRLVYTPNGLLPFKSPDHIHVRDPGSPKMEYSREWHIQMPKSLAERILAIGLP